jgi:GT2 family glycosyltransferase
VRVPAVECTPLPRPAHDVSVVICAYSDERFGDLAAAIESVQAQTIGVPQIVVAVDRNAALLARVQEAFPSVIAVPNTHHPGAGGARNSGVAAASGNILVFIDDDVKTEPDWLGRLLEVFHQPDILGAGGGILPLWATDRPRWFPEEFDWVVGCTYVGLPTETASVRNVISANMAVRREVFEGIDGFLAGFGKQGSASEPEETEFCIRALERWPSRRWLYVPAAVVHHRVTDERETWRYFLTRCKNEGKGKARMTGHAQVGGELSSERRYATRVLPLGVMRGLLTGIRGDLSGPAKAAAIVIGFAVTAAAYVLESRKRPAQPA